VRAFVIAGVRLPENERLFFRIEAQQHHEYGEARMNTAISTGTTEADAPIVTPEEEMGLVYRYVSPPHIRIIEAGCGRLWPKELANPTAVLIGVDTDAAALALRKDLTETHLADIRTITLPSGQADVVYSSYVLEHVDGAERALSNFVDWVKPGGIIILRIPDRDSAYGFLTRVTPHWVHIAYYKYIVGYKHAGKPGFGPYPTFHEPVISRRGLRAFCAAHGCDVLHELRINYYLRGKSIALKKLIAMSVSALSLGALSWRHNNLCVIIRKNATGA
jgi:SAM-dependent methyltransferase